MLSLILEWRRGLYELISNGIRGNIKKDNVVQTLGELTVRSMVNDNITIIHFYNC